MLYTWGPVFMNGYSCRGSQGLIRGRPGCWLVLFKFFLNEWAPSFIIFLHFQSHNHDLTNRKYVKFLKMKPFFSFLLCGADKPIAVDYSIDLYSTKKSLLAEEEDEKKKAMADSSRRRRCRRKGRSLTWIPSHSIVPTHKPVCCCILVCVRQQTATNI